MKKSYDYFKTLNLLSETVSVIYDKTLSNDDFESRRISFLAEKSELLNSLRTEFITPLERGDIFFLAECLTEELCAILSLQELLGLIKLQNIQGLDEISLVMKSQNNIFSQLGSYKTNLRLFEQCSDVLKSLNIEKKRTEKHIVESLYCKGEQSLIKYAIYSSVLSLNRYIHKTFLEIERILINNS